MMSDNSWTYLKEDKKKERHIRYKKLLENIKKSEIIVIITQKKKNF